MVEREIDVNAPSTVLHDNPVLNTVFAYVADLSAAIYGSSCLDMPQMARHLDKYISAGKFVSRGQVKLNPVILRLRGDYALYWKQLYPTLRAEYPDKAFSSFFYKVYQHMTIGGHTDPAEIVVAVRGQFDSCFTYSDLTEFMRELKLIG